jgi:PKD domain
VFRKTPINTVMPSSLRLTKLVGAVCLMSAIFVLANRQPASASATPTWLAPVNLAEEENEVRFGPYAEMDGHGDAIAVWDGLNATNETLRPAADAWEAAGSLAAEDPEGGGQCAAASSEGEALALRTIRNATNELVIQAVQKPPSGGWQVPVDLAKASGVLGMSDCHVAVDPSGDAVAVWSLETEFEFEPVWAAFRPSGGTWQPAVELASAGSLTVEPSVAIDPRGDAAAVWSGGSGNVIQAAFKPVGQNWEQPELGGEAQSLSEPGNYATAPQVAFDSRGDAFAVWSEESVIQASFRAAGGMWQKPVALSQTGQKAYTPQVATDAQGDAVAVWALDDREHWTIQDAERPTGGGWQAPVDRSEMDENAYYPQLAMDSRGDAVAVWEVNSGERWSVQGAAMPAGEGWQSPVSVSEAVTHGELFPQVAIDSQGDAVAAWELYDRKSYRVQAAGYQAAGPQPDGLVLPATGTAGAPVGFSVSPLDVWAGLRTTRWNFGDASSTTGTSVTHTYVAPGTYRVTLTSEDVLGNISSASGTIIISPTSMPASTPRFEPSARMPTLTPALAPPRISAASQTTSTWREGSKLAILARKKKLPTGTTFSFTLNEQASVSLTFAHEAEGREVSGKCIAQREGDRHSPHCRRKVSEGTLLFTGHADVNKVFFEGRISRSRKLKLGKYTVAITATNAAGQRSNARSLSFIIVK